MAKKKLNKYRVQYYATAVDGNPNKPLRKLEELREIIVEAESKYKAIEKVVKEQKIKKTFIKIVTFFKGVRIWKGIKRIFRKKGKRFSNVSIQS